MTRCPIVFLALAALTACGKTDPDPEPLPMPDAPPASVTLGMPAPKADHTATAAEWHAEFKADQAAAKKKYKDKVIELRGTVSNIVENVDAGIVFVHLKIEKDFLGVRCGFKDAHIWERVTEGSEVTIRGKVPELSFLTGELMPVALVSVEKNPAQTVSAVELTKRFKADFNKLKDEYNKKWVYVEGEFVSSGKSAHGASQFKLKGADGVEVTCGIPADAEKRVKALKPGQRVKTLGQFSALEDDTGPNLDSVLFKGL